MTARLLRHGIVTSVCTLMLANVPAEADETDLLRRLEEQQQIIHSQSQRIDKLEQALETILETKQNDAPNTDATSRTVESQPSTPSKSNAPATATSTPAKTTDTSSAAEDPFAGKRAPKRDMIPRSLSLVPCPALNHRAAIRSALVALLLTMLPVIHKMERTTVPLLQTIGMAVD